MLILCNCGLIDCNCVLCDCNYGYDKWVFWYLGFVECMGDLYVVIFVRLDEYLLMSFMSL